MDQPLEEKMASVLSDEKNTSSSVGDEKAESQSIVIKLPAKLGKVNINNTEQLIQLLQGNDKLAAPVLTEIETKEIKHQDVYKCAKCEYSSHNKHYLKQHVELVHLAERPFKCPFCDYAGKRSHSLKEHLIVHSSYRPYECHFCNATFRKKGHLTNHIKLHASETQQSEQQKCNFCDKEFESPPLYWQHLRTMHKSKSLSCGVCQYATTHPGQLKIHSWSHKECFYFQCTSCDFICEKELDMMVHINGSHQGVAGCTIRKSSQIGMVILLKCSECGFTTSDKQVLKKHMFTHVKPSDTEDKELVEDKSDDTSQPIYKCDCGYTASTGVSVLEHIQSEHGPNTIPLNKGQVAPVLLLKCSECGFSAPTEDKMRSHMLVHLKSSDQQVEMSSEQQPRDVVCGTSQEDVMYKCAQCEFASDEAYDFMAHMLTHEKSSSLQDDVPLVKPSTNSQNTSAPVLEKENTAQANRGYTHDTAAGVYRCAICSYVCDHQRTIKAHIWKHSGHKDVDYPMFQNGPLSMFDYTPVGVSRLASGKSIIASTEKPSEIPKVSGISQAVETRLATDLVSALGKSSGLNTDLYNNSTASSVSNVTNQSGLTSGNVVNITIECNETTEERPNENMGVSIQGPSEEVAAKFIDTSSEDALKRVLADNAESPKSLEDKKEKAETVLVEPPHVVVEAMTKVYPMVELQTVSYHGSPACYSAPATATNGSDSETASEADGMETVVVAATDAVDSGIDSTEVAAEVNVAQAEQIMDEDVHIEEAGCVDVYTSHSETLEPQTELVKEYEEVISEASQEEALSLLSLLKKGPNYNPACPVTQTSDHSDNHSKPGCPFPTAGENQDSPSGISHSLLAAIEHLRKTSTSDDSEDEAMSVENDDQLKQNKTGTMKTKRRTSLRRAVKRKSSEMESSFHEDNENHVEKVSKDGFRCKLCHYTTTSVILMKAHLRSHKSWTANECSFCDFESDNPSELQDHILQHCKKRSYSCKLCISEFSYKSQLRSHMRVHDHCQMKVCDNCDFSSANALVFRKHVELCKDTSATCTSCKAKFPSEEELEQHMESKECSRTKKQEKYECEKCDFSTMNQNTYSKHQRWHGRTYSCHQCSFVCSNYKGMVHHQRVHAEEKDHKCEFCDFVAKSVRSLKSHMKRHANDQRFVQQPLEQYVCNLCGYVCHHLPSLKSHMWRHSSDTNYSYEHINEIINAAIDFDAGVSPSGKLSQVDLSKINKFITFRCCQCGFESLDKALLNSHMKFHMDIIRKTLEVNQRSIQGQHNKEG